MGCLHMQIQNRHAHLLHNGHSNHQPGKRDTPHDSCCRVTQQTGCLRRGPCRGQHRHGRIIMKYISMIRNTGSMSCSDPQPGQIQGAINLLLCRPVPNCRCLGRCSPEVQSLMIKDPVAAPCVGHVAQREVAGDRDVQEYLASYGSTARGSKSLL